MGRDAPELGGLEPSVYPDKLERIPIAPLSTVSSALASNLVTAIESFGITSLDGIGQMLPFASDGCGVGYR